METCCCDHLEEQLFPRSSLGEEYVVVHSEARNLVAPDPEFFRILALAPGTRVTTSLPPPDDKFTLDAGQIHELMAWGDFIVTASAAVTIGQFQVSQDSSPGEKATPRSSWSRPWCSTAPATSSWSPPATARTTCSSPRPPAPP